MTNIPNQPPHPENLDLKVFQLQGTTQQVEDFNRIVAATAKASILTATGLDRLRADIHELRSDVLRVESKIDMIVQYITRTG
jgi:hypothetical protein